MKRAETADVLEELERARFFKPCVTAVVRQPPSQGTFVDFPQGVGEALKGLLRRRGVERLYSHQLDAYEQLKAGRDVVVVTPTASGKSLCYNLAVLNDALEDPTFRALYLFPTKALAQDQLAEIQRLTEGSPREIKAYTYDGDTPADIRRRVRTEAQLVITNPDMLHTGILPHHTKWNRFFSRLGLLVIDEMHTYRGVFGSHMVNVLRRFWRVCAHYGSRPKVVLCSATLANPAELGRRLIGRDVAVVEKSGAPTGEKVFYFVNPPVVHKELGLRASSKNMTRKIAERFLRRDISTIVFTTSRLNVEILTKYMKDLFRETGGREEEKVRGYRGGYLPKQRRQIESGLREGKIKGVVSTNALELGVDIGSLGACVLCGYPGSVASTWQQAGRAGRRAGVSCAFLVARSNPMDQFVIRHPDYFFGRSPEHARVNPDNLTILVSHVQCAAFELPFRRGETFGGPDLEEILDYLAESRILRKTGDMWYWAREAYPAGGVSLRTVSAENFLVVDRAASHRIIAEVDNESAPLTLYAGAIYMVESDAYQVEELDYANRKAYVTPVHAEYYTEAVLYTHVKVLRTFVSHPEGGDRAGLSFHEGEVHVSSHVAGYKKLRFYSAENLGYGDVNLPDQEMHTSAFWISVDPVETCTLGLTAQELLEALDGAGYAMVHMASFLLMCEARDFGRVIGDPYRPWFPAGRAGSTGPEEPFEREEGFQPALFLYDAYPGGIGLSEALFRRRLDLIEGTRSMIEACACESGCPSCVGPAGEGSGKTKENAARVLRWMICAIG